MVVGISMPVGELVRTGAEVSVSESRVVGISETELVALSIPPEAEEEEEAIGTTTSTTFEVSQQTSQNVSIDTIRISYSRVDSTYHFLPGQ